MNAAVTRLEAMLLALDIGVAAEASQGRDAPENHVDKHDRVAPAAAGASLRLAELQRAADRITQVQLEEALAEQRRSGCGLGDIMFERNLLTRRERDVVLEVQQDQAGSMPLTGAHYLGHILVATGQLSQAHLDDALHSQTTSGRRLGDELIAAGRSSKAQIDSGLFLQSRLVKIALIVAALLVPLAITAPPVDAAQTSASLQVSARVIANTKVQTEHQATQLKITEADVARGHIDVPSASRFLVTSNSPAGYLVVFHPLGNIFESVQIAGLGNAVQLGADGGAVALRGPLSHNLSHDLSYRFVLRADTPAGNYQWPLQFSVRPL
jgi:hypothetical protein